MPASSARSNSAGAAAATATSARALTAAPAVPVRSQLTTQPKVACAVQVAGGQGLLVVDRPTPTAASTALAGSTLAARVAAARAAGTLKAAPQEPSASASTVERRVKTDEPVRYRSDSSLFPEGTSAVPLRRKQRAELSRIAAAFTAHLKDCRRDLDEAQAKLADFRRSCPGKAALDSLCEELQAEEKRLLGAWRAAVAAAQATWPKALAATAAPSAVVSSATMPAGIRPQVVQGRPWYSAVVRTKTHGRLLGPLRPTVEAASADRAALLKAAGDSAEQTSDEVLPPQKRLRA